MTQHEVGLPLRPFMYTIDQIAYLLEVGEPQVRASYLHYEGRSVGVCPKDRMLAVDISPDNATRPEWRVAEVHLKRWMRFKGWKIVDRGYVK